MPKYGEDMLGYIFTNLQTKEKSRTIHGEVIKKNIQGVASLIENGVNPNLQDEEGKTPLHIIALYDDDVNIAIAKLLLKKGADPNLEDQKGRVPLHIAARRQNPQMVDVLLASEKTEVDLQDNRRCTPLFEAVGPGLYFYGKKENIEKDEDFYRLDTFGDEAEHIVKALLFHGADPNFQDEDGNTPLHIVAFAHPREINIAIVKLLLDDSADPNSRNEKGDTPLHFLARTCYPEISEMVQLLLEKGADPNLKNEEGEAPLHTAAFSENVIMVSILLESEKTNVNLPAECGWTPLFFAIECEDAGTTERIEEIRTALLQHGASLNYQDENGNTPLHIAVWMNELEAIEIFIKFGAEVNRQNKEGKTPLHIAVEERAIDIVKDLIDCGADVNIECNEGRPPFYLAAVGCFSSDYQGNRPRDRCSFDMVKIFLDKEDAIDWKDEGYRKEIWDNVRDEKIKELLIPIFQCRTIWDLWEMEKTEFNSYIQWVPQEIVEETAWSFFKRNQSLKRKRIDEEAACENPKRFCQELENFSYSPSP